MTNYKRTGRRGPPRARAKNGRSGKRRKRRTKLSTKIRRLGQSLFQTGRRVRAAFGHVRV